METFRLSATIPTGQYANIIPEIEVEAETFEEARDIALLRIQDISDHYSQVPLKRKETSIEAFELVTTFTGEQVKWYADRHEYTDLEGNHLISGSEYAHSFEKPFDTIMLSGKVATKHKVDAARVAEAWKANSKTSTTFGSSLHLAMEQWFRFRDVACGDKEYNLAKPAFLRAAVKAFPLKDETILPEVVLSNIANKMAGTTDGLLILGEKTCEIEDYKSDSDIVKNLPKHFRQLSYYAKILQLAGWSVGKVTVWNWTDKWDRYDSEVLEVN